MCSSAKLTPKMIVQEIMTFVKQETKEVVDKASGQTKQQKYVTYKCPKPQFPVSFVTFAHKAGFQNPYAHLKRCYARGTPSGEQDSVLHQLFESSHAEEREKGGIILSHFVGRTLSEYEKTMYAYIRLVVMKRLPVTTVTDSEFRSFSKHDVSISRNTLQEVIIKLVDLVEKEISKELRGTKGAVMYDGWTHQGTHYVGMILSYSTQVSIHENGNARTKSVPRLTLIAVYPMASVPEQSDDDAYEAEEQIVETTKESTKFNAEAYINFFRENLSFFGLDFDSWCVCLLGDNCSTNPNISKDTGKPHVGCNNHKVNLEVNKMLSEDAELRRVAERVSETMTAAKSRLRNAAMLRNLTDLKPVLECATRWSGICRMMQRFNRLHEDLLELSETPQADLPMNKSSTFSSKVRKYSSMLSEIDVLTTELQSRGHTLAACRADLDDLIQFISENKTDKQSSMYNCTLGTKYIGTTARIVHSPAFESAVVKLQNGLQDLLTDAEKDSVASLRVTSDPASSPFDNATPERNGDCMKSRLLKRRKVSRPAVTYMDCQFILGMVAEIERFWSQMKSIVTQNRNRMTAQLLEALVFLEKNERFWDSQMVAEAIRMATSERSSKRIKKHKQQMDLMSNI